MPVLQQRFQHSLRQAIADAGMNQTQLAEKMGVSKMYVSKYLNGVSSPGLDVIEKFSKALGLEPHDLLLPAEEKIAS